MGPAWAVARYSIKTLHSIPDLTLRREGRWWRFIHGYGRDESRQYGWRCHRQYAAASVGNADGGGDDRGRVGSGIAGCLQRCGAGRWKG